MNKQQEQGTPSQNSTPSSSSENAQLQWAIKELNKLSASHECIRVTLEQHIINVNEKISTNHIAIKDSISEKCGNIDQKINDKHDTIISKMSDKSDLLKQSISTSEQEILNKIKDMQSANTKWLIGVAIALGVTLYRVFTS